MSSRLSSRALARTLAGALAVLAVLALVVAAATDHRATAFSLNVSDNTEVAALAAGEQLCEGPIAVRSSFARVAFWSTPGVQLAVSISAAGALRGPTESVATTRVTTTRSTAADQQVARLSPPNGARRIRVCIRNVGRRVARFAGGYPTPYSGAMTVAGHRDLDAIAFEFLRTPAPSLLSLLPDVFRRASLFKLSWVGPWTFWLLALGVLGAFGLAVAAVGDAVRADDAADHG